MRIETICVGELGTNCYLAWDEETKKGFVVDPGAQAEKIIAVCSRYEVIPEAILLTHGHFDHMMAAEKLKDYYGILIYAGVKEVPLLADARANLSALWAKATVLTPDYPVKDQEELFLAGQAIRVLNTPGHTPGGVCYYLEQEGVLFAGDTLFFESYGRTDFPGGSTCALFRSIQDCLLILPEQTVVYPGHGQATDIGYERKYNPASH